MDFAEEAKPESTPNLPPAFADLPKEDLPAAIALNELFDKAEKAGISPRELLKAPPTAEASAANKPE